ncbi:MAG: hypothetical protein Q4F60_00125 [Candidatus Saccharibacteria bacterium]|nr:hypothetical protein [Candidatus Saccharibacteria bacterium]
MKLKIGEKVYLQVYDLIFIACELGGCPTSIVREAFSYDDSEVLLALEDEAEKLFWFKYCFREPENVEWLMAQDWIVSYNKYAEASISELNIEEYFCNREFIARMELYEVCPDEEEFFEICKLEHKLVSLSAFGAFHEEKLRFRFPEEFREPRKKHSSFWAWLLGEE